MPYFFETGFTIPPGQGFPLFGRGHLLWLAAWVLLCLILTAAYRRWPEPKRLLCRRAVAGALVLDELFKYAVTAGTGRFQLDYLPLHLCSVNLFLIAADAVSPRESLREVLYAVCLPGAFFALLFPGWGNLPMANGLCIHSFLAHILLFLYPCLLLAGGFRPRFSRFVRVLPFCLLAAAGAYGFNRAFGTNFMFLRTAGTGNPLSWFEARLGNPGYLLGLPVLCGLSWALLYGLPRAVKKVLQKSRI